MKHLFSILQMLKTQLRLPYKTGEKSAKNFKLQMHLKKWLSSSFFHFSFLFWFVCYRTLHPAYRLCTFSFSIPLSVSLSLLLSSSFRVIMKGNTSKYHENAVLYHFNSEELKNESININCWL